MDVLEYMQGEKVHIVVMSMNLFKDDPIELEIVKAPNGLYHLTDDGIFFGALAINFGILKEELNIHQLAFLQEAKAYFGMKEENGIFTMASSTRIEDHKREMADMVAFIGMIAGIIFIH
jgi:hypothetical protein